MDGNSKLIQKILCASDAVREFLFMLKIRLNIVSKSISMIIAVPIK